MITGSTIDSVVGNVKKFENYYIGAECERGQFSSLTALFPLHIFLLHAPLTFRQIFPHPFTAPLPRHGFLISSAPFSAQPTCSGYDKSRLRAVWHLEETTRASAKMLGGAGHHEHRALSFF